MAFDLTAALKIAFAVNGQSSVKQARDEVRALGDEAQRMGTQANRGAAGLDQVADRADLASRGLSALRGVLYGVAAAFAAGIAASVAFAREGIAYNAFLETARLGIASLIAAQTDLTNASGRPLKGMEALAGATLLAEDQMQKLRIAGLETSATTEQLAEAFQQAVGAGLAAGLNLDQIRSLTIGITQAAGALGVPMHQISQEVRAILSGTIDNNARVAQSLGISNEMVRSWREQGKLAEELNKRLETFQNAGVAIAQTWSAVKSNMAEAASTFAGEVTQGMFEQLKASGQRALAGVFDSKNAAIAPEFQGLAERLSDIFDRVGGTLGRGMEWAVEQARGLSGWLSENKTIAADLVESVASIGRQFLEILATGIQITKFIASWTAETGAVSVALRMIALLVAGVQDGVKLIGAAFAAVGGAILEVLFKPLETWLRLMGRAANFIREGWGDSLIQTADEGRAIYQSAYASAAKVVNEFRQGQTAVARLRKEWEDFDGALDKTAKKTSTNKPNYTGRNAPGSAEPSRADQGIASAIARFAADAAAKEFEERFGRSAAVQSYFRSIAQIQPGGRFAGASDSLKRQFAAAATERYQTDSRAEQAKAEFEVLKRNAEEEERLSAEVAQLQSRRDQERLREWTSLQDDLRRRTQDNNIDLIQDDRTRAQAQLAIDATLYRARIDLLNPNIAQRQALESEYNDWLVSEQALLAERFKPEWQKLIDAWSDTTRLMRESFDDFILKGVKAGEEAFVEFARTGKLSVRDLVDTVVSETARMAYRQHLAKPVASGLQAIGGRLLGAIGSGSTTPADIEDAELGAAMRAAGGVVSGGGGFMGLLSSVGRWVASLFHEGGIAGSASATRAVDPLIFHGAKRFHDGRLPLRSDEVPAILRDTEGVFTQEQMRHLAPAGAGKAINLYQTVNVLPGASRETANQAAMRVGVQTQDVLNRFIR